MGERQENLVGESAGHAGSKTHAVFSANDRRALSGDAGYIQDFLTRVDDGVVEPGMWAALEEIELLVGHL